MKVFALAALAACLAVPPAFTQNNNDPQLQQQLQKALSGSQFRGIQASVQNGLVTLTGSTDLVANKYAAERKVHHVKGINAFRDEITVSGPEMSDQQLANKVGRAINNELWGNVPIAFQTITVQAQNGVVILSGHAAGPIAAEDAVAVAENTKGAKDVVDNIQIDPVSDFDNQIRMAEFRAIYGDPMLSQYAMDPAKPIRIQVSGGHVTLYGMVDSEAQKDTAGIRANTVPNVFSVTNDIQVANGGGEKPKGK